VGKKTGPRPAAVLFYHNNAAAGKIVSFKDSLILNTIQIPYIDTFINGNLKYINVPQYEITFLTI
jgi:hypothetical protein